MQTGWVRLSRTCNNACLFCDDVDALDGVAIPTDVVRAELDALAAGGATRVVLSGGEPTLARSLLVAIKHAKELGLRVSLTTNGRILQSEAIVRKLQEAGLDEIRVSVHSGRRANHDRLVGREGAWIASLAGLRYAGRTNLHVVLVSVLTKINGGDLHHLLHLAMMGGAKGMEVRQVRPVGTAAAHPDLRLSPVDAALVLSNLWYSAKEEVVELDAVGFDDTIDLDLTPTGVVRQLDAAGLRMLRKRVFFEQAFLGFSLLGDEDSARDVVAVVDANGGLPAVGLELAARSAPFVDAPWCVGGRPTEPARWGGDARFGAACDACPMRARCPGLPAKGKKLSTDALAPLPSWTGVGQGTALVVGGRGDDLLAEHTLPALAAALAAEGLDARYEAEATSSDADLVVCGDAASARPLLASRRPGQRIVVLDTGVGEGLAELPSPPDVIEAFVPGRVDALVAGGVDLRTVRWRPYPVPPAAVAAPSSSQGPIVVLGEGADWALVEAAIVHATGRLGAAVEAYGPASMPDSGVWTRHVDASDEALLAAVLRARFVVLAEARSDGADARARLARDVRWLSVAQAAGKPVVVVRGPGADDHVRHDRTGWCCPATGVAGLAEGLIRLAAEPPLRERYGREARASSTLADVTTWARDLVHGRLPDTIAPDALRPHPVW